MVKSRPQLNIVPIFIWDIHVLQGFSKIEIEIYAHKFRSRFLKIHICFPTNTINPCNKALGHA
jgi:hypothetical protein